MVRDFNVCSRIGNITTPTNSEKRMTPAPGTPAHSAPGRRYHPARAADREHTGQSDRPTHPGERRDQISRVVHEPNSIGFFFRKRLRTFSSSTASRNGPASAPHISNNIGKQHPDFDVRVDFCCHHDVSRIPGSCRPNSRNTMPLRQIPASPRCCLHAGALPAAHAHNTGAGDGHPGGNRSEDAGTPICSAIR